MEKTAQEFFFFLFEKILHVGSLVGTFRSLEIGLLVESEHVGQDVGREATDGGVVVLGRFVKLPSGVSDGVFASFEL